MGVLCLGAEAGNKDVGKVRGGKSYIKGRVTGNSTVDFIWEKKKKKKRNLNIVGKEHYGRLEKGTCYDIGSVTGKKYENVLFQSLLK